MIARYTEFTLPERVSEVLPRLNISRPPLLHFNFCELDALTMSVVVNRFRKNHDCPPPKVGESMFKCRLTTPCGARLTRRIEYTRWFSPPPRFSQILLQSLFVNSIKLLIYNANSVTNKIWKWFQSAAPSILGFFSLSLHHPKNEFRGGWQQVCCHTKNVKKINFQDAPQ